MTLLEKIENYVPFNSEEENDKKAFIYFLNTNKDVFKRDNMVGHVTVSSHIVNKERTKVLLCFHNIYNSWSWTGGHSDGDDDLISVALKEAKEETGVLNIKPLLNDIFSLEVLTVDGHYKNGKYVSSHLHYNVTFLLEADEADALKVNKAENKDVGWFSNEDFLKVVSEEWMIKHIYKKLLGKEKIILNNFE